MDELAFADDTSSLADLFPATANDPSLFSFDPLAWNATDPGGSLWDSTYTFGDAIGTAGSTSTSVGDFFSGVLANLPKAVQVAQQVNSAWKAAGSPAVQASTPTTTVNSNGTLTTRNNATGQALTSRMTVGTPYVTASGYLITNNGNGTFTTVAPDGSSRVDRYPDLSGGNTNLLILGGLAVGAFLLLKK